MNDNTMTAAMQTTDIETEVTTEERLAQITAAIAAKQAEDETVGETPKAKLAPFTCPMDPAERAACDSCQ